MAKKLGDLMVSQLEIMMATLLEMLMVKVSVE